MQQQEERLNRKTKAGSISKIAGRTTNNKIREHQQEKQAASTKVDCNVERYVNIDNNSN
jgi:hypothetical protein